MFYEGIMVETAVEGDSLFHEGLDGTTLINVEEVDRYREWLELTSAGS